jgi:hypothetical protein
MLPPTELPTAVCAVCGKFKGPTNNWFKAITPTGPISASSDGIAFGASNAEIDEEDDLYIEDICGSACLHTRLSRWIETHQALTVPAVPSTEESETK